jgi:hypothetical protein
MPRNLSQALAERIPGLRRRHAQRRDALAQIQETAWMALACWQNPDKISAGSLMGDDSEDEGPSFRARRRRVAISRTIRRMRA